MSLHQLLHLPNNDDDLSSESESEQETEEYDSDSEQEESEQQEIADDDDDSDNDNEQETDDDDNEQQVLPEYHVHPHIVYNLQNMNAYFHSQKLGKWPCRFLRYHRVIFHRQCRILDKFINFFHRVLLIDSYNHQRPTINENEYQVILENFYYYGCWNNTLVDEVKKILVQSIPAIHISFFKWKENKIQLRRVVAEYNKRKQMDGEYLKFTEYVNCHLNLDKKYDEQMKLDFLAYYHDSSRWEELKLWLL